MVCVERREANVGCEIGPKQCSPPKFCRQQALLDTFPGTFSSGWHTNDRNCWGTVGHLSPIFSNREVGCPIYNRCLQLLLGSGHRRGGICCWPHHLHNVPCVDGQVEACTTKFSKDWRCL